MRVSVRFEEGEVPLAVLTPGPADFAGTPAPRVALSIAALGAFRFELAVEEKTRCCFQLGGHDKLQFHQGKAPSSV